MGIIAMFSMRCDECGDGEDMIYSDTRGECERLARDAGFRKATKKEFGAKPVSVWRCLDCRARRNAAPKGFVVTVKFSDRGEVRSKVKTYEEVEEMRLFITKHYSDREVSVTTLDGTPVDASGHLILEDDLDG